MCFCNMNYRQCNRIYAVHASYGMFVINRKCVLNVLPILQNFFIFTYIMKIFMVFLTMYHMSWELSDGMFKTNMKCVFSYLFNTNFLFSHIRGEGFYVLSNDILLVLGTKIFLCRFFLLHISYCIV